MSKETPTLNEMLKLWTKKDLWERIQQHIATIDKLKHQLAEKDKEIETQMMSFEKECQEYYKSGEYKRDFAIQELEKVKAELVNNVSPVLLSYTEYVQKVFEIINQRITEKDKENEALVEEMELSAERRQIIEQLTIENKHLQRECEIWKKALEIALKEKRSWWKYDDKTNAMRLCYLKATDLIK